MGKSRTRCIELPNLESRQSEASELSVPATPKIELPEVPEVDRKALQKRLELEGRWSEGQEFLNAVQRDLRRGKKHRYADVEAYAWWELERNFPPYESISDSDPEATEPAKRDLRQTGRLDLVVPFEWGELPASADLEKEVLWVHQNRLTVVRRNAKGVVRFVLRAAHTPAPSHGALSWLEFAVSNPTKFMSDVLPRALKGTEDESAEAERERKAIDEIGRVLEKFKQKERWA